MEIGLPVPEKKIFKGFLPYMVMAAILLSYKVWFRSTQYFLRKSSLNFLYVHDLGPRSRNVLDLQYSHIFIKSICLRSLAAIVSENPLFSLFPIEKPKLSNLTLP